MNNQRELFDHSPPGQEPPPPGEEKKRRGEIYQDACGWWIAGYHSDGGPCGPYLRKTDAEQDRRGMKRTYKEIENP